MQFSTRALLLIVGLVLLAGAAWDASQTRNFLAAASVGKGAVTRLNAGGSHPQIDFHQQDGSVVSYPQGGLIDAFHTGQLVRVLFNPANPAATARVDSLGSLWGGCLALAACGAVVLALALTRSVVAR